MPRQCPECAKWYKSFPPIISGEGWQGGNSLRECVCGFVGEIKAFPWKAIIPRDLPAGAVMRGRVVETAGARRQRELFDQGLTGVEVQRELRKG